MMRIVIVESVKRLQLAYGLFFKCTLSSEYAPQVSSSKYDTLKNQTTESETQNFTRNPTKGSTTDPSCGWMALSTEYPHTLDHLLNHGSTLSNG